MFSKWPRLCFTGLEKSEGGRAFLALASVSWLWPQEMRATWNPGMLGLACMAMPTPPFQEKGLPCQAPVPMLQLPSMPYPVGLVATRPLPSLPEPLGLRHPSGMPLPPNTDSSPLLPSLVFYASGSRPSLVQTQSWTSASGSPGYYEDVSLTIHMPSSVVLTYHCPVVCLPASGPVF